MFYDFIISVLSLLVTVLIGWQLWSWWNWERSLNKKVDQKIYELTKHYDKQIKLLNHEHDLSLRILLVKTLGLVHTQAYGDRNSRIMLLSLNYLIKDIVEHEDSEHTSFVQKTLSDMIRDQNTFPPFQPELLDQIESELKKMCKYDNNAFDCLDLLRKLRS